MNGRRAINNRPTCRQSWCPMRQTKSAPEDVAEWILRHVSRDSARKLFPADRRIVDYNKLAEHFDDPDFLQVISGLRLGAGRIRVAFDRLIEENGQLIAKLEGILDKQRSD